MRESSILTAAQMEEHPLHNFGYPKDGSVHGFKPEFVMARTLQRNPNARVRKNLNQLHFNLSAKFGGMSDESIEWLLGGSRKTCRGGFVNASEFREFLITNPECIQPAQLISKLESVISAIGYRSICDRRQEEPITPETADQKEMHRVISEITDGQLVRSINSVYAQRVSDRISGEISPDEINVISCEQDEELSDGEDDAYRGQPKVRIPTAQFKIISDNNHLSWIYQAWDKGVYTRNHVSGTTPLVLAAITGLLRQHGESHSTILDNEAEARELFTALLMPKFLRSGYHSLAETQAGIDHFIAEHNFKNDDALPGSQEIDPLTAEQRAYFAMLSATCNENTLCGITPQKAMEDYILFRERK